MGVEPTKHDACDLKSHPFDRSGMLPGIHDGIRTRNLQISSLTRSPVAPPGRVSDMGLESMATGLKVLRSTN